MVNSGENTPETTGSPSAAEDIRLPADTAAVTGAPLAGEPGLPQNYSVKPVVSEDDKAVPGLLELIYGILFDPVRTFRKIAQSPPLGRAVVLFSLVKIMTILVGVYSLSSRMTGENLGALGDLGLGEAARLMAPVVAAMVLVYEYLKWFIYSGILYLLAELAGGRGRAAGVLTATGLAALPALLFLPVQILAAVFGGRAMTGLVDVLIWLAVVIWGAALVVVGLRETQQLSTGRAIMVALTPAIVIIFIILLAVFLLAGMLAPLFDTL